MKTLRKIAAFCLLAVAFTACRKEDENLDQPLPVGLGGDNWARGPIDVWLYDSLTKPYNIEVRYRWDPWEVSLDKSLVPPDESKVIPAMSAMKRIWIDPYNAETGSQTFIKRFAPKSFILVGSPEYNYNGTILLGQAESGNKIAMYVINYFDKSNVSELRRMLHTIQHEFAHILHQNVLYPQEFKTITPNYTSTWFNVSEGEAQAQGFATAYSMSGPDDDFVEMVATMLVEGKQRFDELVSMQPAAARAIFRRKEEIVVAYFRQVWNIDFYSLQRRTQEALNNIAGVQPIANYLGFGKAYTVASVNPANTALLPQSAGFMNVYNTAKAGVQGLPYGLTMDSMALAFSTADTMSLRIYLHTSTDNFAVDYYFGYTRDAANVYTFTYGRPADADAAAVEPGVTALINYFNSNRFKVDWHVNPNNTMRWRALFTPQQTANAHFTALMLPE